MKCQYVSVALHKVKSSGLSKSQLSKEQKLAVFIKTRTEKHVMIIRINTVLTLTMYSAPQ